MASNHLQYHLRILEVLVYALPSLVGRSETIDLPPSWLKNSEVQCEILRSETVQGLEMLKGLRNMVLY